MTEDDQSKRLIEEALEAGLELSEERAGVLSLDPEREEDHEALGESARAPTWWLVDKGEHHNGYMILMYGGRYPFGCRGNSRHHGIDVRPQGSGNGRTGFIDTATHHPVRAWGECVVRLNRYDPGGYNRYLGLYFPRVDASLDIGHLWNRNRETQNAYVGKRFSRGDVIGEIGTKYEGLGARHVHFRVGRGNWGGSAITPCADIHPYKLWEALGL